MQHRMAGAVMALMLAAVIPANAEPNDNTAGTLGEFAAAREVFVTLPPARPVPLGAVERQSDSAAQNALPPRRTAVVRSLWINYGTGF